MGTHESWWNSVLGQTGLRVNQAESGATNNRSNGLRVNQAELNALDAKKGKSLMRNWTDQEVDAGMTRTGNRYTDASVDLRLARRGETDRLQDRYAAARDSFSTVFDEKVRRMRNMKGK